MKLRRLFSIGKTAVFYLGDLVTLNGQPYVVNSPMSISELLSEAGFEPERVAVLLNGDIVAKEAFGKTEISDGDALEVVSFVGGG